MPKKTSVAAKPTRCFDYDSDRGKRWMEKYPGNKFCTRLILGGYYCFLQCFRILISLGVVTLSYRGVDRQYWGITCRRSTNKEDFFNTANNALEK